MEEAPDGDSLVIGIAPPGGKIPISWRPLILEAIKPRDDDLLGAT